MRTLNAKGFYERFVKRKPDGFAGRGTAAKKNGFGYSQHYSGTIYLRSYLCKWLCWWMQSIFLEEKMAVKFTINDFSKKSDRQKWAHYALTKDINIFGKIIDKTSIELSIYQGHSLIDYISKINDWFNWLGGDNRKDELIKYFNENVENANADNEWFENLGIYGQYGQSLYGALGIL
jgi:hypothetical protein